MKITKQVILPDRVRKIDGSFSFIPHTFVTHRFFTSLNQHELLLYFLLVLVGDRHGLSYYSQDRLCTMLRMCLDQLITARNSLIEKSLIAFDALYRFLSEINDTIRWIYVPGTYLTGKTDFVKPTAFN